MSDSGYSREHLLDFLKESAMAGHMNPATARSRRSAVDYLLAHLPSSQTGDLRQLDVDQLCLTLHKLEGTTVRPEALELYGERLKAALADFYDWMDQPADQERPGSTPTLSHRVSLSKTQQNQARTEEQIALESIRLETADYQSELLAIPLRKGCQIHVANLPHDLTTAEAERIAAVIRALGQDDPNS